MLISNIGQTMEGRVDSGSRKGKVEVTNAAKSWGRLTARFGCEGFSLNVILSEHTTGALLQLSVPLFSTQNERICGLCNLHSDSSLTTQNYPEQGPSSKWAQTPLLHDRSHSTHRKVLASILLQRVPLTLQQFWENCGKVHTCPQMEQRKALWLGPRVVPANQPLLWVLREPSYEGCTVSQLELLAQTMQSEQYADKCSDPGLLQGQFTGHLLSRSQVSSNPFFLEPWLQAPFSVLFFPIAYHSTTHPPQILLSLFGPLGKLHCLIQSRI